MTRLAAHASEMRAVLPATLEAVEDFVTEFRRRVIQPQPDGFISELLLREALNNAVLHGGRCDSVRQVHCIARVTERRLLLIVKDDGEGFAWRRVNNSAHFSSCSGRGVEILRKYATRVRYNTRGNVVTILKCF